MDAQTLADVMGNKLSVGRYQELLPGCENAMRIAQINNLPRAAMWFAQVGHESGGLQWMEEIADGSAYNGRADLGNTQPGDGPRFKGRGPIQLTGRVNYRAFTRWINGIGLSDIDFEARPQLLSEPYWGFLAAAYYWVVARPDINNLSDDRNVTMVTRRINGGENGLADRIQRFNRAWTFGDRIMPGQGGPTVQAVEKVLPYSRAEVRQDTYYFCGPATTQTILWAKTGNLVREAQLATELGTTVNGTNGVGQIARVLNARMGGNWIVRNMHNDPPTSTQREQLWRDVVGSINGGVGVAINIWAPVNNYPKASYTSTQSPAYSGGFVMHYIAAMGYAIDQGGQRHVWIADSGFAPYGYWCTLNQLSTLIPPREYAIAADLQGDTSTGNGDLTMDQAKYITDFIKGYVAPIVSDVKDIRQQLTGGRDAGEFPGWAQLGKNAKGQNLTVVDAIAALRHDVDELKKQNGAK